MTNGGSSSSAHRSVSGRIPCACLADWENFLVHRFSRHYRLRYGGPVGKIALDLGVVCPNRQRGGCTYCRPAGFTPFYLEAGDPVAVQLAKGRRYLQDKRFARYFAYFQQETPTAAPLDLLFDACRMALADPACIGIIVSTRPDVLPDAFLDRFASLAAAEPEREFWVELGLQSAHDETLARINRNHTWADFADAMQRLAARPVLGRGAHLILGLPGEGPEEMRETVHRVAALGVDAVKFHHLQVIAGTDLARQHARRPLALFEPDGYLALLAELLTLLPRRIVVHRLWSTADPDLLVAPRWNLSSHELNRRLTAIMRRRGLRQGRYAS